jgi:signal transduction histidine kinase
VVRRVQEPVLDTPSFAAQVLRRFMENPAATATPQQKPLAQKALSAAGLINYRGPARTVKTVSYYQALDYERMLPPGLFTDKIVLVGWSLQGTPEPQRLTGDVFLTPFSWSAEGLFPGVEIQATIIDNLLEEQLIHELDAGSRGLALLGLALALSAFFFWINPVAAPLAATLWCGLLLALAEWVFALTDLWLPVFSGIMIVVLTYGGHLLVRTLTAERERRQLLEATNRELESKVAERTRQLSERHRQLEATYRALVNTQAHLIHSEKMASLGMLVAGVAHEINNPLSYVHSNLEFIEDHINRLAGTLAAPDFLSDASGDHPQKIAALAATLQNVRELIASCQEGSQRVKKIVLDLRLFSRADDTGLAPTDLHASLESTLNLLARQYQDRITIHRDYGVLPLIECYPGQIHQVLMNLLQNAMQAIPDRGEVWIHTESAGDEWVRLVIRDNGVGIAQEDLNRIFDPFFTTKPIGAGTGLGLSISYGIVKKHGGNIQVRSKIAEGTALILELPVRSPGTTT